MNSRGRKVMRPDCGLTLPNFIPIFFRRFAVDFQSKGSMAEKVYRKWQGHLAVFSAYLIFGFNIIVCKDLTSSTFVPPVGIFMLRALGAGSIFWLLSLFMPHEHVPRRDMLKIFYASVLGFFLAQLSFLMAIPLVTPMESALMSTMGPVVTMLVAAVAVHEPLTSKKICGVAVSLAGIVYLILTSISGEFGGNIAGFILMTVNIVTFSAYLGIFRPLINRYSVVTFMKWIFLFAFIMALPFGIGGIIAAPWTEIPGKWYAELAFLVVMATFVTYYLIPFGQKIIRPTLVSLYNYVQPIVAIGVSIALGMDSLTLPKVVATVMVFGGVYIVSRSRSRHNS